MCVQACRVFVSTSLTEHGLISDVALVYHNVLSITMQGLRQLECRMWVQAHRKPVCMSLTAHGLMSFVGFLLSQQTLDVSLQSYYTHTHTHTHTCSTSSFIGDHFRSRHIHVWSAGTWCAVCAARACVCMCVQMTAGTHSVIEGVLVAVRRGLQHTHIHTHTQAHAHARSTRPNQTSTPAYAQRNSILAGFRSGTQAHST